MSERSRVEPRSEDPLAAQRAFLRQVIDLNPSFIFAKDREGRFTLVNQALAENYGTTVEAAVGKTDADFNRSLEEVEHFRRDDLEVMDTRREKVIPEEVITDASGRQRYLHTIKRPIVGPDGVANQVLGVALDITARKRLEEQLAQAQRDADLQGKMGTGVISPSPPVGEGRGGGRSQPTLPSTCAARSTARPAPRARRAAITLRPPTVAMRARKPWRRERTILLG